MIITDLQYRYKDELGKMRLGKGVMERRFGTVGA
jgi:hypothetical protein